MNLEEKFISTQTIFNGKIFNVHRDDVLLPNGKTAFREVVEHSGAVMVAPLDENENLIFVRQYRYPFKSVLLELPAGKLEKGENALEAGIRELKEEVGAVAEKIIPLGKIYPTVAFCSEVITMFAATNLHIGESCPDEDEFIQTVKIPLSDAVEMVMNGEIVDGKTIAAVLKLHVLKERGDDFFKNQCEVQE